MVRQRAFTLIELIVVVVLLGVMAAGAGMLISKPIEAYSDQVRRQQLVDSAEMSLRKITTDIRRALPNSIRVLNTATGWALEMVNTVDGARYRDEAGDVYTLPAQILDFSVADKEFNLLGQFSNLSAGDYPYRAVIYNTNNVTVYRQAELGSNPGIITSSGLTLSDDGEEQRVTLSGFHQFTFPPSPGQRIFLVDGPISYICDATAGQLTRYTGYAYRESHAAAVAVATSPGVTGGRVASQVSLCNIDYDEGPAQRGGLVTLEISITDAQGESVSLLQQVHVDNLP